MTDIFDSMLSAYEIRTADIEQVKQDVRPFLRNAEDLDIWSNDYFLQLATMIRFA